jgi:uncharacterized protein YjdB
LTVAANETSSILYVIVSSANNEQSQFKQIRVTTVTGVTVNPINEPVRRGRSLQFIASVAGNNSPDNAVTWKVSSNTAGTGAVTPGTAISSNGLLKVAPGETLTTLYVMATSVVDPSKSRTVPVGVIIPVVTGVVVSPPNQTVSSGRSVQFYASITGTNEPDTTVQWIVSSNAAGTGPVTQGTTIDANGVLTVAPNETVRTLFVFARSVEDPTKSGSVIVNVIVPTVSGIAISPTNLSINRGGSFQFNASITGTNNPVNTVIWKVSSNAAGTGAVTAGTHIDANGMLTVAAGETAAILYIFAISAIDTTKSASVPVTVIIPVVINVTVSPSNQSVEAGKTLQFYATVTGANNPNTAVTWKVSSNAAGTGVVTQGTRISNNGLLTVSANEPAATLYVFATSVADTSRSGSVSVNIPARTVTPPSPVTPPHPVTPRPPVTPPPPVVTPPPPVVTPPPPVVTPPPPVVTPPTVSSVTVSPVTQSTKTNSTVQFNASITGTNNPNNTVTWKVSSDASGTGAVAPGTSISANGLLKVAPNEWSPTLYVIATSVADPSKSATATVMVINANENQGSNRGKAQR